MNRGFYCNKQRMIRNKGSIHAHFLDVKTISFNLKNFIQLFAMFVIYRFDFDLLTKLSVKYDFCLLVTSLTLR